jgi:hypothetical protein
VVRTKGLALAGLAGLVAINILAACTGTLSEPGGLADDDSADDTGDDTIGPDDGDDTAACADDENQAPVAPIVMSPLAGLIDVLPDDVTIQTSPFSDPDDGDEHQASQFEIWLAAGGEPVIRVWWAEASDVARLTRVSLADGTFEVGDGSLDAWADYQVRARYRDGADCGAWSEWSPSRKFRTDDGSTYWFDPTAVRDVRIELAQTSIDAINAQASPPGCVPFLREYYPGNVVVDDDRYDGAGVRTKGGCGSSRTLDGKPSFKINLSWADPAVGACAAERRSHGLKRLTMNNMVQDRSYVHERLAYRFYQLMGVPTPRANYTRVHVNDELYGLYNHIESIDRRFLSRWFADNDGMLYEGTYSCDLVPGNVPPGDEDTFCISRKFQPDECDPPSGEGDPEDYTPIREMVQQLAAIPDGEFYPAIDQIFDFDTFLSLWAVETVLGHWDGYTIQIVNNYRIYHDPSTDRWTIIPTGVDQTFDQSTAVGTTAGLVATRCWNEEDCRAAFMTRLAQATNVFEGADLAGLAATLRDQVAPLVTDEDPRKEGSVDDFQNQVTQTIDFITRRPGEIRAQLVP